jgi:hypothetical protein
MNFLNDLKRVCGVTLNLRPKSENGNWVCRLSLRLTPRSWRGARRLAIETAHVTNLGRYAVFMLYYIVAYNINERNDPSNDPSFAMTSQAISDTSRFGIVTNVVGRDQINVTQEVRCEFHTAGSLKHVQNNDYDLMSVIYLQR